MFGKARDINDTDTLDSSALDDFFGDEAAAENSVEIHDLRDRVEQAESQINSQFTSLATYAQIAQEQVELARSEARAATERSEQRLTSLIERERADRITAFTGEAPEGSPDIASRLDALEHSVAHIQKGLDDCRQQQKDLAVAITTMFDRLAAPAAPAPVPPSGPAAPVSVSADDDAPATLAAPLTPPPFGAPDVEPEPAVDLAALPAPDASIGDHIDRADSADSADEADGPIAGLSLNG